MNKGELIAALAKELKGSKAGVGRCVDAMIAILTKGLKKDKEVALSGLGIFRVKQRKARMGRNLQTGKPMKIAARKAVSFKAAAVLKKTVN